jgi:hypothetical protein
VRTFFDVLICILAKHPDMKSKRPVTKSASADHKDVEEFARPTKTPSRKTPAQVKAESAARKAKVQVILFQKHSFMAIRNVEFSNGNYIYNGNAKLEFWVCATIKKFFFGLSLIKFDPFWTDLIKKQKQI